MKTSTSPQPHAKQPKEEDVYESLIISPHQNQRTSENDSGSPSRSSDFVRMQTKFIDQAKEIQDKIKKEFPCYVPALFLDIAVVVVSIILLGKYALLMPVCLSFAILAGIYAKCRLNTLLQHFTATVYTIATIFNVYFFIWRLILSDAHVQSNRFHIVYLVLLALSAILHNYIAVKARQIQKLLQERDILLAGFKLRDNGRRFDIESHHVYVRDSSELHKNVNERVGQIEKTLRVEFSYFYHISLVFSVILVLVFLLETHDPNAFKMVLLLISGAIVGIYANWNLHLLGQIYSFSVISMFIFTSIVCTFIVFLMMVNGHAMNSFFAVLAFIAFTGVVCKIAVDLWGVTKLMQERASLLANLARWKEYNIEN